MSAFLPIGGGTMAGPLHLAKDAVQSLEAVTYRQLIHGANPEEDEEKEPIEEGEAPTVTLSIRGAIRSAVVVWTELSGIHGNGYYEIEIDTSINFDSSNLQSGRTMGLIMGFDDLVPGAVYYCRLRARNAAGELSGWSSTTNTELGLAGGVDIEANSIQAAHAVFDEAAIVDADIADLNVGKLTGGQIEVGEWIESSNFSSGTAGWNVDGSGNAEFNNVTVRGTVDSSTVTASTITGGTFQTATTGNRVEITNAGGNADRIRFLSGSGASIIQVDSTGLAIVAEDDTGISGDLSLLADVSVTGTLYVSSDVTIDGSLDVQGSKNFVIPHPLYADREVVHASYEGPGPGGTIYRYRVDVVDGEGQVVLPDYFDGINRDVDVHVSPVGHFGRAYGKVTGNTLDVVADVDGEYAVLLLGMRDDVHARTWVSGDDVRERR